MKNVLALISGLVFGFGLILSGMANPAKVIGFLDIAGSWDPSLAFVMGGAIAIGFFAFKYAETRDTTLLGEELNLPRNNTIDKRLIGGSLVFGAGWGLGGFCPGPGLVSLGMGYSGGIIFALSMVVGMLAFELIQKNSGLES
ncbi:MAG: DUF6691 family protein [Betaproteobacteria bacterium]|jgi:uncharacterized membrane protein YedE/YeeE